MKAADLILVDPEKLGGTPVFFGTCVPVQNFFEYLKGGEELEVFLDSLPTAERKQLLGLMREAVLGKCEVAA